MTEHTSDLIDAALQKMQLGHDKTYTPEEVNLTKPLVFQHDRVFMNHELLGPNIPLLNLKTELSELEIQSQVDYGTKDRAVIPVWIIEAEIKNGFIKGALSPMVDRRNGMMISISQRYPTFDFYLESDQIGEFGVCSMYTGSNQNFNKQIDGYSQTMIRLLDRSKISTGFTVYAFYPNKHMNKVSFFTE